VPTHLKRDWGLLFDRARWLRKRGQDEAARPLLLVVAKGISGDLPAPDTWWKEVQYQVREALDAGETRQAYELAAHHRLPAASGEPFVAAEFLAGWIALRFLNKPEDAYRHFEKLASAAKVPVTKARAHYWLARTAEARGLQRDASANYRRAATFPLTYYGQLARDIVGGEAKLVAPDRPVPLATRQKFERRDEISALRALIALNETALIREFSLALADQLTTRDEFILLTEMLQPAGLPGTTVRTARRGAQKNLVAISAAYPQIELPNADIGPVPSALVLGLVRQESEFNPLAVSSAGARGLMQLMPATARATAKAYGMALPVDADLFAPERNLAIGQAHLADLLRSFDGSYVLAIGAYNAGAHRVRTWIERYGDPRNSTVDTVDWIERIPFSETRSYVQRVLENVQVYRELLGDEGGSLVADLERGAFQPEHGTQTPRKGSPASVTARSDG
jgi:soluble lytic murein transglycosylase